MFQIQCWRRCALIAALGAVANAADAQALSYPDEGPRSDVYLVSDYPPAPSGPMAPRPTARVATPQATAWATEPAASWEEVPTPGGMAYAGDGYHYGGGYDSGCDADYACEDCGVGPCECTPCPPRSFVFGEFLYLRPTGGDVTHAQQQDGTGGAGTVPFGRIASIGQDYEPGFRVGIGCCLSGTSAITASYTFFESSAVDSLDVPVITGGFGAVGSLVHHPAASITASTGPVDATQSIDFQLADVMFRDVLRDCGWCVINYSLGGQYGQIEQDFSQTGIFSGGSAGTIDTDTAVSFYGGGIKGGLDIDRHIGRGVTFYGKTSAALMSGRFQADYSMVNSSTAVTLARADWEDNRIVPQVEFEVGVSLNTCDERWRVTAGYQFQHWLNVVTTPDFIDAVQADNYTDLGDTLSFDGLTARIERRW